MDARTAGQQKGDGPQGSAARMSYGIGRTRLPRINSAASVAGETEVMFVDGAFAPVDETEAEPVGGFASYFSAESLFEPTPDAPVDEPSPSDRPFAVLGVSPSASMEELTRARRALMLEYHPDRFAGAEPEIVAHAERRVRDINEAFAEIRRRRSPHGR